MILGGFPCLFSIFSVFFHHQLSTVMSVDIFLLPRAHPNTAHVMSHGHGRRNKFGKLLRYFKMCTSLLAGKIPAKSDPLPSSLQGGADFKFGIRMLELGTTVELGLITTAQFETQCQITDNHRR